MTWLTTADIPVPQLGAFATMADFMLAYGVHSDLMNADSNFLSGKVGPQYANPGAYIDAKVAEANGLIAHNFKIPYAPVGAWDPEAAGKGAAMSCFSYLLRLPVSAGDADTVSVMEAWVMGTGNLPGGHPPIPANTSDGVNEATGQSAAPAGSIL